GGTARRLDCTRVCKGALQPQTFSRELEFAIRQGGYRMNIGMVSEHASPLCVLGGVDAGGQNVHVAELSAALARLGHTVTVYTRRDDERMRRRVQMLPGVTVEHVTAGPAVALPK